MEEKKPSILTRLFTRKQQEEIDNIPEIDEASIPTVAQSLPHTLLVFTPAQEAELTARQKEDLQQKLTEMPPLTIGEINFVPYEARYRNGEYFIRVFIRNGKNLDEAIQIAGLNLALIDASGDKVASGGFKLNDFGTLKFGETRYWVFVWTKEYVLKPDGDLSQFSVEIS